MTKSEDKTGERWSIDGELGKWEADGDAGRALRRGDVADAATAVELPNGSGDWVTPLTGRVETPSALPRSSAGRAEGRQGRGTVVALAGWQRGLEIGIVDLPSVGQIDNMKE
ncbi:hypothetical protein HAX54_047123 [Datura stramonium]|uniref:Uncharacterized protein n=1 Tax=Datura stramonium TaxID=4076 RepID=A0ABS8WHX8_DATST|nr:hypothetical protein [Datura stramonium]